MGTGVGTERGGGGEREATPAQSQRELARGRGGSAPSRPDLSRLTSFFLCPSPSLPPLCLPVPSPMANPCGLAPPLFLRYLALSLSASEVGMRGRDVSGGGGGCPLLLLLHLLLLVRTEARSGGAPAGWGAQVQEQLRSYLQAGGSEASGGRGQRFQERRSHYIRLALLGKGEKKAGAWGVFSLLVQFPGVCPPSRQEGKPQPPPHWSSPSLSLSLSPLSSICKLSALVPVQTPKHKAPSHVHSPGFSPFLKEPSFSFHCSFQPTGREGGCLEFLSYSSPTKKKKKKVSFLSTRLGWEKTNQLGLSPRVGGRGEPCLSVCVGCLVCFGFVSGGGLQVLEEVTSLVESWELSQVSPVML